MKQVKVFLLPLLLAVGCSKDNLMPEPKAVRATRLQEEEYFIKDLYSGSTGDFVAVFKKVYHYDQHKLIAIDAYEFNPYTHAYGSGYRFEEYHYTSEGKLSQSILSPGPSSLKWIKEYEYHNASTRVTRYKENTGGVKSLQDWWVMERTPPSLIVKYYQGNNELYAQLTYTIDEKGNAISVTGYPSPGKVEYEYDHSPNPYKFPELSGEYGLDSEKYISENNMVAVTKGLDKKTTRTIEYDDAGYPVTIITSTSKRIFTYQ